MQAAEDEAVLRPLPTVGYAKRKITNFLQLDIAPTSTLVLSYNGHVWGDDEATLASLNICEDMAIKASIVKQSDLPKKEFRVLNIQENVRSLGTMFQSLRTNMIDK